MRIETTVSVAAPREAVWAAMTDVESWPEISESVTSLRKLDPGPLRVGARVRLKQPKLPPAVWTVTELSDSERFSWATPGLGFRTTAFHEVAADGEGSLLRLGVEQDGPLSGLVGRLFRGLAERYVDLEATGLKRRAEAAS